MAELNINERQFPWGNTGVPTKRGKCPAYDSPRTY